MAARIKYELILAGLCIQVVQRLVVLVPNYPVRQIHNEDRIVLTHGQADRLADMLRPLAPVVADAISEGAKRCRRGYATERHDEPPVPHQSSNGGMKARPA